MIATVEYHIATYQGKIIVNCDENDEEEVIIAKAKRMLTQQAGGALPFGYESWKVIEKTNE